MKTRLYRVVLLAVNALAAAALGAHEWGPGVGLSPEVIGILAVVANALIVLVRQVGDGGTPTLPPRAP